MAWPIVTVGGSDYWKFSLLLPVTPTPNDWAQILLQPDGMAAGVGIPAIADGPPGLSPILDPTEIVTEIDYDDPDPVTASWAMTDPGDGDTVPPTWQRTSTARKGPAGSDGDTVLTPTDFGTPNAKQIIRVNSTLDGFEYQYQLVGDRYVPASIANTPSGNSAYTLCSVAVPAQNFDWRPEVAGQCIVTGTGADVRVDLIARLNNATSGNEVGRAFGQVGINPPTHVLSSGPPTNAGDADDKVAAGAAAVIYLRAERQTGANTFTTSGTTTRFTVRVRPIL